MQIYLWATLIMVRWGWKDFNETVLCKISTPLDFNNPLSRALSFKACRFFFNLVQHNEQQLDECQIWALYQFKGVVCAGNNVVICGQGDPQNRMHYI